ncbi:MAG: orotidine-5'-phosphate decarboxylase [Lentisphaerae bacterium]|nr:orotidine-5'-phosphate decarboxylase [Lentisphaerota bacterium]
MSPRLVVALDIPSSRSLPALLQGLPPALEWFKVGLELFAAEGPRALAPLREAGKRVFLDLKLHDIPRTVARAVDACARHGVGLLTLHAAGGRAMLEAAARAAREAGPRAPKLIAVTTLTSLDAGDLADLGIVRALSDQAEALAHLALEAGIDGLVTSVHEAAALRRRFGPKPLLVTPGIRPADGAADDQKRVDTPARAVRAGADFLVVGRPILEASDPRAAAEAILADMRSAAAR